jgi:hypothetical protein
MGAQAFRSFVKSVRRRAATRHYYWSQRDIAAAVTLVILGVIAPLVPHRLTPDPPTL